MPERPDVRDLEASTTRWMRWGIVLMVLLILAFPAYRIYEPSAREASREAMFVNLAAQGRELWQGNCASCHGVNGEGVDAPALNSQQFLGSVSDEQVSSLIAHGIPGSEMVAYGLDFGGPLTSEQIEAITVYLRSLEPTAPDRPDWRDMIGAGHEEGDAHDEEEGHEEGDAQDEEQGHEEGDAHDEEEEGHD